MRLHDYKQSLRKGKNCMRPEYQEVKASLTAHGYGDLPLDTEEDIWNAVQQMMFDAETKQGAAHALQFRLEDLDDGLLLPELILQVYSVPTGQWAARLLVDEEEVGVCAACVSVQAVVDSARASGIFPDRVEVLVEG